MIEKIIQGDCLEKLKELETNSVDSIVTDPPYELGFMGKSWDNTGIANNKEMWAECLRVLKPGGHLLAFSGTRTYHRMASSIEDAGFEVRDMIEWVYGSGFPKSLNIGKAINKIDGVEFESKPAQGVGFMNNDIEDGYHPTINQLVQKGDSSERAKQWEGWGTALKPAHEPICMARKPLAEKTVAENCLKWGVGGINIDESRVETSDDLSLRYKSSFQEGNSQFVSETATGSGKRMELEEPDGTKLGRFPANLIHDNSEEVRECFPNESGRFFKSIIYQAKASKSERNRGCEELELKEIYPQNNSIERKELNATADKRVQNNHPTVKPIALMEYLIKMVTPKGGIVLDPFAGSGSTLVAAKQNGYEYIGIEMTEEYIQIIEARLKSVETQLLPE